MKCCIATTLQGKKCQRNSYNEYCCIHDKITCGICLDESPRSSKKNKSLDCKHIFCKSCINTWIIEQKDTRTCPTCRKDIVDHDILEAKAWGRQSGLLYEATLCIYPLAKLEGIDAVYIMGICNIFRTRSFTGEQFRRMIEKMNDVVALQKLADICYYKQTLVKKDLFENNPKIFHSFVFL